MTDMVNHPPHYQLRNGMEVIDLIKAALTPEEFRGYLKGNNYKYMYREPYKGNSEQDVAKAIWYAERYKEELANKVEEEATGIPVKDIEFVEVQYSKLESPLRRILVQISEEDAQLLASQMAHPAYEDYQLVLTWEKK